MYKQKFYQTMILLAAAGAICLAGCAKGPMLKLEKTEYDPGEKITVEFKALDTYADNAWVGIIPGHVEHGSETENDKYDLTYQYLKKRTEGMLTFSAPNRPGEYDLRMHDTDSNGTEVASVTFVVK